MTLPLFDDDGAAPAPAGAVTRLGAQAVVLLGAALSHLPAVWPALQAVVAQAGFRHMATPGGRAMQVALTNCGALGWVSDARGYRYSAQDPATGQPWPALPAPFLALAQSPPLRRGLTALHPTPA